MAPRERLRQSGRPRDPDKDRAVLEATRDLLAEAGYRGTTIAAVARRAGVGAPTVYRRWPRREALIEDAAFGHAEQMPLPVHTGDLRTDLRAWLEVFLGFLASPVVRAAVPGLLVAWQQDDNLYAQFRFRNEGDVQALFAELLTSYGVAEHFAAAYDFVVNATMVRALTLGMTDAAEYCDRTAAALLTMLQPRMPSSLSLDITDR